MVLLTAVCTINNSVSRIKITWSDDRLLAVNKVWYLQTWWWVFVHGLIFNHLEWSSLDWMDIYREY